MNVLSFYKNRFVWLFLILIISLGLVGVALAAASHTGGSIPVVQATPPQTQGGVQPVTSLPPSPRQVSSNQPVTHSPPDPLSEQMRQQAMSASQGNRSIITDAEAGTTMSSLAPQVAGTMYLPGGIVVDVFLDRIYGNVTSWGNVVITRVSDGAYGAAEADDKGFFWTSLFDGAGGGTPVDIVVGDQLVIDIDGSPTTVTVGQEPSGYIDVLNNTLYGNIPIDTGGTVVTVTLGLYGQPSNAYSLYVAVTDGNGDFSITFNTDIGPENFASIDYLVDEDYQRTSFFPQNVFLLMQNSMIAGYAPRENNVHATVYFGDSWDIRWQGDVWAGYPYGWFVINGVEMAPGDKVIVDFPGGSSTMYYVYASWFTFQGDDTVSGGTDPNTEVRVSFLGWDGTGYTYTETHTTADGSGNFTAFFTDGGIRPDTRVDVAIMDDDSGAGSYMVTGRPYVEAIIDPGSDWDCVIGRVDVPNANMTLNLIRDGQMYTRTHWLPVSDPGNLSYFEGCFLVWWDFGDGQGDRPINFETGDILRLSTNTPWSGEVTVVEPHWTADANSNQVNGEIFSGQSGEVAVRLNQTDNAFFGQGMGAEVRDWADPTYTAMFNNFDVRAGVYINTYFYDPVTGFANQITERNHYFQTMNDNVVWGYNYIPNELITLRLLDPGTLEPVYTSTNDLDSEPFTFYFDFADCNQFPNCPGDPPLQPGIIVEVLYDLSGTGDGRLTYQPGSVQGDPDTDMIYAIGKDGMLDLTVSRNGGVNFDQMAPTFNSDASLNTTFFGYDLIWGDMVNVYYRDPSGNLLNNSTMPGEIQNVQFWTPNNQTSIWGNAEPNHPVTITTSRGDTLVAWANNWDGSFNAYPAIYLYAGDLITVTAGLGNYPVTIVFPEMLADSDSTSDQVFGHISYPNSEVEIYPDWEPMTTTLTNGAGNFTVQFQDIPRGGRGYIRFINNWDYGWVPAIFHRPFYDLEPVMQVNYGHDWVEGQYDPGYPVAITVTNELGEIKATAHGVTGEIPWWGGDTGFSTNFNIGWDGARPDMQIGDYVYLTVNGRTTEVHLGAIEGVLDSIADTFQGNLNIPWLTDPVWVDCGVWVENGPGFGVGMVDPNGGTFTCDFGAVGWDLQPGMDVGVSYQDPSQNRVYNVFREPTPHLYINYETQGEPTQGGNYAFRVHYNNDGSATALGVFISQSFDGMTYISDTLDLPHTGDGSPGSPLVWQLGDLPPNYMSDSSFFVFVSVDRSVGEWVYSDAEIDSSMAYYQDYGSKHFHWEYGVKDNNTDLNINKGVWTWDPVPGYEFVYNVNVCNKGSTSSSEVYITDTLPLSTTLVEWWGQYPGWEEVTASDQLLVVKRPTAPGWWCGEVYLKVLLSEQAWPGMPLHNDAWVWASNDTSPDNHTWVDHNVGSPSYNLHLNPQSVQGQFVPGGEISFDFNYSNWGNMPMPGTMLTTTLPAGTEFLYAYTWDWQGWVPLTPDIITDEYLVWNIGTFPNGYNTNVGIRLKIADDTPPGTPLVVEVHIMGEALEYRYDDNTLVFNETVNPNGPNLRVDKHSNWNWHWEGRIGYDLRLQNLGTETLYNVTMTDTYPVSTTTNPGNYGWNGCPGDAQCIITPTVGQVIYWVSKLEVGWNTSAWLNVDLDPDVIGDQGLAFVNQLDAPVEGDVAPQDNHDEVTSYTGPDVFVRKWLKAGELSPGELITYTVEFGNSNRWPWNGDKNYGSHITDTIPMGTTFVDAILYQDLQNPFDPDINGRQLVWPMWPMWAENTWTFDLVLHIDEDIPPGGPLLNVIEAWGDSPNDIDPNPANNYFEYLLVDNPGAFGKVAPADGVIGVPTNPTLSWGTSDRATVYEYCYDTTDDDACDGAWVDVGLDTSVDLSGLVKGTTYYWQVRALKTAGTTYADEGLWWSFTIIVNPPADFGKTAPTNGAIDVSINPTLSWEASSGASSYQYCLDMIDDDACSEGWIDAGSSTSVDLTGLSNDITYYWQVQAVNAGGTTDANGGTWWSFTTIVSPPANFGKLAPANGAIDISTSPTLSWEASSGASSYQYCLDMTDDYACSGGWTNVDSNTSVDLTGLSNEITYYWQVLALNVGGTTDADASIWWSFTTETGIFHILLPLVQK